MITDLMMTAMTGLQLGVRIHNMDIGGYSDKDFLLILRRFPVDSKEIFRGFKGVT